MTVDHNYTLGHYRTLELTDDASAEEIRSAYFRLVRTYHPDHNPGNPSAAARFKKIQQAYEVLSKRRVFARCRHFRGAPLKSQNVDAPTSTGHEKTSGSSASSDAVGGRRRGKLRVGRWLSAATAAAALAAMLWGLSRETPVTVTAPSAGSTQASEGTLPSFDQVHVLNRPAAEANHAARHADDTGPKLRRSTGDHQSFAKADFQWPFDSWVPRSLRTLPGRLSRAFGEKLSPEEAIGRLHGPKQLQPDAADMGNSGISTVESRNRTTMPGAPPRENIVHYRGNLTGEISDLVSSSVPVPKRDRSRMLDYDRNALTIQTIGEHHWEANSLTPQLDHREPLGPSVKSVDQVDDNLSSPSWGLPAPLPNVPLSSPLPSSLSGTTDSSPLAPPYLPSPWPLPQAKIRDIGWHESSATLPNLAEPLDQSVASAVWESSLSRPATSFRATTFWTAIGEPKTSNSVGGAGPLPPLPESRTHIRSPLSMHAGEQSLDRFSAATGNGLSGGYDGSKFKLSSNPKGPDWLNDRRNDGRAARLNYERPRTGPTTLGSLTGINGLSRLRIDTDQRPLQRPIDSTSLPNRGILRPYGDPQPPNFGRQSYGDW